MAEETAGPSPYERRALDEIDRFKNADATWLGELAGKVSKPVDWLADKALDNTVGEAFGQVVQGLVGLLNDGVAWSVREEVIFEEFRSRGHAEVKGPADIRRLDLEAVDQTVGMLDAKYKALGLVEGAGVGALGAAALAVAIPALVGLAQRAVAELATYYGFDVASRSERAYVLEVLTTASAPTQASRKEALKEATNVARVLTSQQAVDKLNELLGAQAIKALAEALGVRLTKAALAQVVPVAGAILVGGYNAWYMGRVTDTAYHLYRERFLVEKYGPEVLVSVRD